MARLVRRGDLVTIAVGGDYGKPRPALVIQDDAYAALASVTVLRLTSTLQPLPLIRVSIPPDAENGLREPSQVMIDKAVTVPRDKIGPCFGRLDAARMDQINQALALFLGLSPGSGQI